MKRRNIKLYVEYDGTNYCGWQSQNGNHKTIQETISQALKTITGKKITLWGAGRTDSGVHSLGQVANFISETNLSPYKLKEALNSMMPADIVIRKVEDARSRFNAQYDARSKTYCYKIADGEVPSVLERNFVYFAGRNKLDTRAMKKAAKFLVGKHDFSAFASKDRSKRHTESKSDYIRKIYDLSVKRKKGNINITIRGNGFLYNMVRTIAGTLIAVGRKRIAAKRVKEILDSRNRSLAGQNIPANGLCLVKVEY